VYKVIDESNILELSNVSLGNLIESPEQNQVYNLQKKKFREDYEDVYDPHQLQG